MAKINSSQITFVDITDSRKLDVYISSNLPTTQIYNSNTGAYSPDWGTTNLQLTADVYLDSKKITPESIKWYKKVTTSEEWQMDGATFTIKTNVLSNNPIITYICRVTYQGIQAFNEITFMRADTGLNGSNGADGTSVTILGSYKTLSELQAAHPTGNAGDAYIVDGDLYVWAVDDGVWENVGNIQGPAGADGKDAKSIVLSGDSQVFKVSKTNAITPSTIKVTAQAFNTTITDWTYSENGGQTFRSDVPTGVSRNGNIVTITGSNITSNSIVIKASDGEVSDVFTVYKAIDGVDGGKGSDGAPAPIAFLTNENVTFSANAQGQITGTTITSKVVAYIGTTKVKPTLGKNADGTPAITNIPNGMSINASEITGSNEVLLTITISNNATLGSSLSNMDSISIPITYPVDTTLSLTWSKVNAGTTGATGSDAYTVVLTNESNTFAGDVANAIAGSTTTQVIAYKGATSQTVKISSVNGKTASITDTDTGIAGLKFRCSTLSGTSPTITFTCTTAFVSANGSIPIVLSVGDISFTKMFTYSIAFKGATGATGAAGQAGSAGVPATAYWLVSSASVVQKTSTGTITVTPSTLTFTGKSQTGTATPTDYACRWIIAYSTDGTNYTDLYTSSSNEASKSITVATTYKTMRARMYLAGGTTVLLDEQIIPIVSDGAKGDAGRGVSKITEYYLATTASSGVTTATSGWTTTIQSVTATNKYLWNYEVVTYTDNSTSTTTPVIIGVFGNNGAAGKGIKSVVEYYLATTSSSGVTTSTSGWTTTMQTLTATNKYLWNYELITYTDDTTTTINPVIIGVYGDKGASGTNASLVDITPSAYYFKSTTGKDGIFTPEYIYVYPRFQNVTFSKWEYSVDGGVTWVAASGANGLTISTYSSVANTLRIARTSTLYTDTITSISFRCVSSNASVYDTVSIAKIYDVVDLQIGGTNLLPSNVMLYEGTTKETVISTWGTNFVSTNNLLPILEPNTTYTFSYTAEIIERTSAPTLYHDNVGFSFYSSTISTANREMTVRKLTTLNSPYKFTASFTTPEILPSDYRMLVYTNRYTTNGNSPIGFDTIKFTNIKLEKGNKATDWSPAPEDVDDAIAVIETRVTNAEQKVTNDAIVSTVRQSTEYKDDLGKKVGTTEIISKINQTAESVTISANKIGLLGATNIPDLTADKIKGGILTLGGSSATTQNGQMIVKNASNADILKLNKDGIVVKSGHLAIAEDFAHEAYDWTTGTWITTDNTSQLDLGDNFIRMGVYSGSNYDNYMHLQDKKLSFQGDVRGIGSWGSSIGHNEYGDFVIEDSVRSDIFIKGQGDTTLARLNNNGLYVNGPIYGGITRGNAKQLSNVFVEHFPGSHDGYIGVKIGETSKYDNSMITIKGHVTAYQDSTSFEASCYYYYESGSFYGAVATATNPDVLKEAYFAEETSTGYIYLLLGAVDSTWNYPTISIETISIGYNGHDASEWNREWTATIYPDLSEFTRVSPCVRGGMSKILWSGAVAAGSTIILDEDFRNFKFLTCVIGSGSDPYGIVLGSFLDTNVTELHFFASTIITGTTVGKDFYVAKFNVVDKTKISLTACASSTNNQAYVRKIVGWR